jgi:hypothetical protein
MGSNRRPVDTTDLPFYKGKMVELNGIEPSAS